jgi:hypothetical protein
VSSTVRADKREEQGTVAQVVVRMKTIDLRKAELQAVAGEDVKTCRHC